MNSRVEELLERIRRDPTAKANTNRVVRAAGELHQRRMTALELFRPFPYQDEFLYCEASEVLLRGGTRSGKSTIIAAAVSSYALNRPMYDSYGIPKSFREPEYADKPNGEIWVIGKQMSHSSTIYRLLCKPGAFQIVKDSVTGKWRAWQPGIVPGDDQIPKTQRKPAPPFIPPSMIEKMGWEKVAQQQWDTILLKNGWTIKFYPSNGSPKRGDPVHIIWLDEETERDDIYSELQSRISDYKGKIWWSSWPDLECASLIQLYDRACDEMADFKAGRIEKCYVYQMSFIFEDNPVIDDEEKMKRKRGQDDATYRARNYGEFVREGRLTYPEFDIRYHCVDYGEYSDLNDEITRIMKANGWGAPHDWCVDLILDPGTRRPALLWVATPPPYLWYQGVPYMIPFRELTGRYSAEQLAYQVSMLEPTRSYHRWIIDHKCGDQTAPGESYRVEHKYSMAFKAKGLSCERTGSHFQPSEHNWLIRSMELRQAMDPITPGAPRPRLRIVAHKCPELVKQMTRNMRKIVKDDVQDVRAPGQIQDLVDTLEYVAASRPFYRKPQQLVLPENGVYRAYQAQEEFWANLQKADTKQTSPTVCGIP